MLLYLIMLKMASRRELTLPSKGKLILTKEILDQIDYLHDNVGRTEWCGILFYRHLEGDINDPKKLKLQAEHIYAMDIGSETYTEADIDMDAVLEMDEVIPDVRNLRKGLIHTHHSMKAFFSGTDMSELHDSTPFHNFYLSLIVNFDGNYVARVAYIAKTTTTTQYRNSSAEPQTNTEESEVLVMIDMDIEWEGQAPIVSDYFRARHETLKQKKAEKVRPIYTGYQPGNITYYPGSTQIKGTPHAQQWGRAEYDWNDDITGWSEEYDKKYGYGKHAPSTQAKLPFTEKDITPEGKLKVGKKELRPFTEVDKEIREKINDWLDDGITNFTKGVNPGTTTGSCIAYLNSYFDFADNEVEYPFFVNQMQRSMLDYFTPYFPGLVRTIGEEIFDVDGDVSVDLCAMFSGYEEYVVEMNKLTAKSKVSNIVPFNVEEFEGLVEKPKGKSKFKVKKK